MSQTTAMDVAAATERAHVLAQALPFLRRYAGATIVVKYGGHAMGEEHLAQEFGSDIALLKQVGVNPVVVHGGGPQINAMLKRLAIQSRFSVVSAKLSYRNRWYWASPMKRWSRSWKWCSPAP